MPQCFRSTRDTDRVWPHYTRTKLGSFATHIVVATHTNISTHVFHESRRHSSSLNSAPEGCYYPSVFSSVELTDGLRGKHSGSAVESNTVLSRYPLGKRSFLEIKKAEKRKEGRKEQRVKRTLPTVQGFLFCGQTVQLASLGQGHCLAVTGETMATGLRMSVLVEQF